ncbi:hypothetical protein AX14_010943 [Amanita brunnescens Koide BX004]|nr:hypothetical protein AX14_010943 [Amanita brunnescens Koide BX004]
MPASLAPLSLFPLMWPPRLHREPQLLLLGPHHSLLAFSQPLFPLSQSLLKYLMGSCPPMRLCNPRSDYIMGRSRILALAYKPQLCQTPGIVPTRASVLMQ